MSEQEETVNNALEHGRDSRFNSVVAVIVSVAAAFMALCNVKDGNIVQGMAQAQARAVDSWSYYQAKGTKQNIEEALIVQLELQRVLFSDASQSVSARLDAALSDAQTRSKLYAAEKGKIQQAALDYEAEYDRLNFHDDQFDAAEACLTVSIALLGVAALTRKSWMLAFGGVLTALGLVLGSSGFLGWNLHLEFLSHWLG